MKMPLKQVPSDQQDNNQKDNRTEDRYPCVGIPLLYSPLSDIHMADLASHLQSATAHDMSLSGLAFDVVKSMKCGDELIILVALPDDKRAERLLAKVRWCNKLSLEHYRVGVSIVSSENVLYDSIDNYDLEPVGKNDLPTELHITCPSCKKFANFNFIAMQSVTEKKECVIPLYDCSECGTTRTFTSILAHNRQQ